MESSDELSLLRSEVIESFKPICFKFLVVLIFYGLSIGTCLASEKNCIGDHRQPVDAYGKAINAYCVVPLYTKASGTQWSLDVQSSKKTPPLYLIWISEKTPEMNTMCLWEAEQLFPFPFGMSGNSIYPTARTVLYLKRGFIPYLHYSNAGAGSLEVTNLKMIEGDSEDVLAHLLSGRIDQGRLRRLYNLPPDQQIVDEFTDKEREDLFKCYYRD